MIFGEDDSRPQDPQRGPQVRLDASGMETMYANFFALAGTSDEITIYLGAHSQLPGMREPIAKLETRVLMNPGNAKRLMLGLQQAIKAHEERFGVIELAPPGKPPQA
ncbi:MAG: DUF3467 domain-containing protein [Phycisphaerae bacterium]|jgi:hypothetical protein